MQLIKLHELFNGYTAPKKTCIRFAVEGYYEEAERATEEVIAVINILKKSK